MRTFIRDRRVVRLAFTLAICALIIGLQFEGLPFAMADKSPKLEVNPGKVVAGQTVDVEGSGFGSRALVTLALDNQPIDELTVPGSGKFKKRTTIPAGTDAGDHKLTASGGGISVSATLNVVADPERTKHENNGKKKTPTPQPSVSPTAVPTTPTAAPTKSATPSPTPVPPTATAIPTTSPAARLVVFGDSFGSGWSDWSWSGSVNLAAKDYVQSGSNAVSFSPSDGWGAFSPALSNGNVLNTSPYTHVRFYVNGGQNSNQAYQLVLHYPGGTTWGSTARLENYVQGGAIAAGQWRLVEVPLTALGAANTNVDRLAIQAASSSAQPTIYLDAIEFVAKSGTSVNPAPTATPAPSATATPVATASPTPSPTQAPVSPPSGDLFSRTNLIYGSEIGGWTGYWRNMGYDGHPVIADEAARQLSRDAKVSVYRWLPWRRFTDLGGDMPRAEFDRVIDGIRGVGAEPFIKLPPGEPSHFSNDGNAFNDVDINWLKEIIRQAGPRVRLYEFTNEPNFYGGWSGSQYVAVWSQVVPQLKAYARSLGFEIIIGGPSWAWEDPDAFEVMIRGFKAEYDRTGNKDVIPAYMSYHTYASSKHESLEWILWHIDEFGRYFDHIRSYWRQVWGWDIPLADTEWNYTVNEDDRRDLDPEFMRTYTHAMFNMFRSHNVWLANQFVFASNDGMLDMVDSGTLKPKPMYNAFKEYSAINR